MLLRLAVFTLFALASLQAAITLYLKGGGDMPVREYEIVEDRVRYYSLDRGAWEEIPLDLVDLERTRRVVERKQKRLEAMRRESGAERAAERKARTELHNVPLADGVYYWDGEKTSGVQQAVVATDKSKSRTFLKIFAPVPIVAGKTALAVEGASAEFVTTEAKPQFYIRDPSLSSFGMVRLKPQKKKKRRVVQILQSAPATNEIFEEQEEIEIFRQQLARGVYKIWPIEPLPAGEYAIIDFTPGESDLRVWDFSCRPAAEKSSS